MAGVQRKESKIRLSIEYVIENYKTKKYLYTTGGFGSIDVKHLIGTEEDVRDNLFEHIFTRDKNSSYHAKYCKWAAGVIVNFVGSASENDLEIHQDTWFNRSHELIDEQFYKTEKELDDLV